MEREAQSLGYLVALAVAGGRNDNRSLVAADPAVVAMHVPAAHGDDEDDHDGLDQMVALAAANGQAKRTSWQTGSCSVVEYARGCRKRRALEAELVKSRADSAATGRQLCIVSSLMPALSRAVGLVVDQRALSKEQVAEACLRLACTPRIRGGHSRACSDMRWKIIRSVASMLEHAQAAYIAGLAIPPPAATLVGGTHRVGPRTLGMTCQWDETQQKLKPLVDALPSGAKRSRVQARSEVMVLSGELPLRWAEHGTDGVAWLSKPLPWRVRPQRLERKDASFIVGPILRCLTVDIRIPTDVASVCDHTTSCS
jgi:hypothetical protein